MITMEPLSSIFNLQRLDSCNYKIEGNGYSFHLYKSNDGSNITCVQALPSEKYSPPPRCVEYLYYDADCRLGLDAIEEFFEEHKLPNLADSFRHLILSIAM